MINPIRIMSDFTQLEKRYAAAIDRQLTRISHIDLHMMAAARIFGVMYSNVTKSQREEAKRRNFAIVYSPGADLSELVPNGETLTRIFTTDELAEHCKSAQVGDANALDRRTVLRPSKAGLRQSRKGLRQSPWSLEG